MIWWSYTCYYDNFVIRYWHKLVGMIWACSFWILHTRNIIWNHAFRFSACIWSVTSASRVLAVLSASGGHCRWTKGLIHCKLCLDCSEGYIGGIATYMFRVHKRFREVSPDLVPKSMTGSEPVTVTVPLEKMEKLPELRVCYSCNQNIIILWLNQ